MNRFASVRGSAGAISRFPLSWIIGCNDVYWGAMLPVEHDDPINARILAISWNPGFLHQRFLGRAQPDQAIGNFAANLSRVAAEYDFMKRLVAAALRGDEPQGLLGWDGVTLCRAKRRQRENHESPNLPDRLTASRV